ncbi:MAG: FG-GAP repeat protein [Planctomycetes bacterium]|nr:FG-GAP repeat protein [Planctomycetota bacterium]
MGPHRFALFTGILTSALAAQICPPQQIPGPRGAAYGYFCDVSGDLAVVSEDEAVVNGQGKAGRVHLYERLAGTWTAAGTLESPFPIQSGRFGNGVAVENGVIVVGEFGANGGNGRAWVVEKVGSTWKFAELTRTYTSGTWMGQSVAISGNTILVSSERLGVVLAYERPAGGWTSQSSISEYYAIKPTGQIGDFGAHISVSGQRAIIGNSTKSEVYIMQRAFTQWSPLQVLTTSAAGADRFGSAVDIHGDIAVVGAVWDGNTAGAAYCFLRDSTGTWQQTSRFVEGNRVYGHSLGHDVAVSRNPNTEGRVAITAIGSGTLYVHDPDDPKKLTTWTTRRSDLPQPAAQARSMGLDGTSVLIGSNFTQVGEYAFAYDIGGAYQAGSFMSVGSGCAGTGNKVPVHSGSGTPELGKQLSWDLTNAAGSSAAALLLGVVPLDIPLWSTCRAYVIPISVEGMLTSASGSSAFPLTVPCIPDLVGGVVRTQYLVIDFGASHDPKLVLTNGLDTKIGGY